MKPRLDAYFSIAARGSSVGTEVRAGVATFLTMAYILFVNPQVLGSVADPAGVKLAFDQVLTVTALVAGVATLAMGIIGRYPFALAAGLGLNAFVAFSLVGTDHLGWPQAMGVIVVEGLVISALVLVGFREAVIDAIPTDLKLAIGIGIGLFITLIGLVNAGVVVKGSGTLVTIAPHFDTWPLADLRRRVVRDLALVTRRVPGALLIGILGTTSSPRSSTSSRTSRSGTTASRPSRTRSWRPRTSRLVGNFSLDFFSALGVGSAIAIVVAVLLSDFFDTAGTVLGVGRRAGLVDAEGKLPGMKRVLLVDGLAAAAGGAASASSNTTFIEIDGRRGRGRAHRADRRRHRPAVPAVPLHLPAGRGDPAPGHRPDPRDRRRGDAPAHPRGLLGGAGASRCRSC